MGPIIILDKSSLQALSKRELILLNKLYIVNIPPILPIEILADLRNNKVPDKLNEEKVFEIANKLIQRDNYFNINYISLVISSMLGKDPINERRPIVDQGKKVKDKDGKIGYFVIETPEQLAIKDWQRGDFSEADKRLAEKWRAFAEGIDPESDKKRFESIKKTYPVCNDLDGLLDIVDYYLCNQCDQIQLLFTMLSGIKADPVISSKIFYRWESGEYKNVKDFAPYFYYVLKIEAVFRYGLAYNLIGTRQTNLIDCQYLYYLPFCNIFTSRDVFHRDLAPKFLAKDQVFINGEELKADLSNIFNLLEKEDPNLKLDWGTRFEVQPPENEDSFTYRMWKKFLPNWTPTWFYKKSEYPKTDEKTTADLNAKFDSFEELEADPLEKFSDEETDFLMYKREITLEDQCVCGSGKKFKYCCYQEGMKPFNR